MLVPGNPLRDLTELHAPGAKAEQEFLGLADQRQRSIVHCTHSEPITIDQWRSNHIVREHIVRMQVSPTMRDETLFAHLVTCDVSAVEIYRPILNDRWNGSNRRLHSS